VWVNLRYVLLDHVPYQFQMQTEILMDHNIRQSGDIPPKDLWMFFLEFIGKVLDGFSYDLYPS
jgi:hypothetical protein